MNKEIIDYWRSMPSKQHGDAGFAIMTALAKAYPDGTVPRKARRVGFFTRLYRRYKGDDFLSMKYYNWLGEELKK